MPYVPYTYRYANIDRLRPMLKAAQGDWLSPGERRVVARFRDRSRCETWLAGRLLAKRLITSHLAHSIFSLAQSFTTRNKENDNIFSVCKYSDIEIRSAGTRPQVSVNGRTLEWSLSIAHTRRGVLVALLCMPGISLGIDLVEPCAYGAGFADVWFTSAEREWLAESDPRQHAIIWAIKEAVYKAVNVGEPFDPRLIETAHLLKGTLPSAAADGDSPLTNSERSCNLTLWQSPQEEIAVFAWGLSRFLHSKKGTVPLKMSLKM